LRYWLLDFILAHADSGTNAELVRKHAFCDTIQFALHGIQAVTFGPGEDGWPPTNEFVDLDKVMIATKTFALAIPRILGVAG
jgi:acetylornithine deacetylase